MGVGKSMGMGKVGSMANMVMSASSSKQNKIQKRQSINADMWLFFPEEAAAEAATAKKKLEADTGVLAADYTRTLVEYNDSNSIIMELKINSGANVELVELTKRVAAHMGAVFHRQVHTYTYTRTYIHTCIHTYVHAYIHTCIHIYKHIYIHTYKYTYI
jgi:hypothetical protein